MHVQLFTVCTELMLSVHRADCERATQPYSSGGGGGGGGVRFFQAQDQPSVTTHVRVGNRVFSHSLDVVSKMHIHVHIIYSHFFHLHNIRNSKLIAHCFCCLLRCVEFSRSLTMSMH